MLEYYAHTHDEAFAKRVLLPTIAGVLTFFAEHYGPEAYAGQLVLTPSQALETAPLWTAAPLGVCFAPPRSRLPR